MEYRRLFDAANSYVSQLTRAVSKDFSVPIDETGATVVVSDTTTLAGFFKAGKLMEGLIEFTTGF
jgi:hypothetical protein